VSRRRKLGPVLATVVVAGNMIGSGIFLLPATLAGVGSLTVLGWVIGTVGALALVLLVAGSGLLQTGHGRVAVAIAEAKMNLGFEQACFRGVLCNALVCVAVWLILAGRTIPSKLAGLILPISAFITLGFEHSIANFYLLPAGLMAGAAGSLGDACANLLAVTLGNLVGGILVAFAIWLAYLRDNNMMTLSPVRR